MTSMTVVTRHLAQHKSFVQVFRYQSKSFSSNLLLFNKPLLFLNYRFYLLSSHWLSESASWDLYTLHQCASPENTMMDGAASRFQCSCSIQHLWWSPIGQSAAEDWRAQKARGLSSQANLIITYKLQRWLALYSWCLCVRGGDREHVRMYVAEIKLLPLCKRPEHWPQVRKMLIHSHCIISTCCSLTQVGWAEVQGQGYIRACWILWNVKSSKEFLCKTASIVQIYAVNPP